jgi:predicted translin family RNA/ssDNA-binding protein
MPDEHLQMRDAVIKLEAKMEIMSESMVSLANSVEKLADVKYELVAIKKDVSALHKTADKHDEDIDNVYSKIRDIENIQNKNSYVIGKVELFWSALVAGGASFVWWLLKG